MVAILLAVSDAQVRLMMRRGVVPSRPLSTRRVIEHDDLRAWLAGLPDMQGAVWLLDWAAKINHLNRTDPVRYGGRGIRKSDP